MISVSGVGELAYENTNQAYVANQNHRNLFSYYAYILEIDADTNRESISGTGTLCSITAALARNNSPSQQERNIYSPQETELETKILQLQTENYYWLQKEVCYEETRIPVEVDAVKLTPPTSAVENVILAGDMCGYAAASFLRTVVYIHIRTPVMAQDDSSVGGKIGINQRLENNLIGAFYQPNCVLKETLPRRDVSSGLNEVIKHALINDAFYFEWQDTTMQALLSRIPYTSPYAIKHMCANKDGVVSQTEKLNGLGAPLNLGHSKETSYGSGHWHHKKTVAAGTLMVVDMPCRPGGIDETNVEHIHILKQGKLPTTHAMMTVDMEPSIHKTSSLLGHLLHFHELNLYIVQTGYWVPVCLLLSFSIPCHSPIAAIMQTKWIQLLVPTLLNITHLVHAKPLFAALYGHQPLEIAYCSFAYTSTALLDGQAGEWTNVFTYRNNSFAHIHACMNVTQVTTWEVPTIFLWFFTTLHFADKVNFKGGG
ncbi:putative 3-dehydroquinate synthase [Helianthus anomalus]